MKKAIFSSVIVAAIEVLVLTQCSRAETTLLTATPPASNPPAMSNLTATHSSQPTETSPVPTPLAPTPTAASLPSINLLYSSGPENAAVVGGNISLYQTGRSETPVILGKGNLDTCWIPSPDGSKVFYVPAYYFSPLNDFVNVIDFRTRQVRQTAWRSTNRCMGLIWHPSGGAFLGSNYEANQLELYRLDEAAPLATIGETGLPAFSPDGKRLAILTGLDIHFYDLALDSAGQVTSLSQEYTSLILPLDDASVMDLRWSPDGTELAILNQRIAYAGGGPNPTELYVFDLADESLVKVADSKELQPGINMEISLDFAWSPDGSKIAFSARTATEAAGMEYYLTLPQVFVTAADGSALVEITTYPGEVGESPQWSPDGTKLIFVAGSERASPLDVPDYIHDHLALSNPDGSDKIVLPIRDFFVLEGPIHYAPFTVLPPDSEPADLRQEPIQLNCASGWAQLESGGQAVVAPGAPNRVRREPKKGDNLIAEIQAGTVVKVLKGPVCADGLVFWRVQSDSIPGGQGWTAEGDGIEYYLEPSGLVIAGGTYYDSSAGLMGMGFVFQPALADGQTVHHIAIQGPPGWNSNQVYQLYPYQPPRIAEDRAIGWVFTTPASGMYTATAEMINGQPVSTTFVIDTSSTLPAPVILSATGSTSQVRVEWSGTDDMHSFLLRLEREPFTSVITETLVAGTERSLTFNGLSLTRGALHRVVIFAFSNDLHTPGVVASPANLSAYVSETFTP